MRRPIRSPQLGVRILAIKANIDTDTATSSIDVGSDDISAISFVSTGILDVTFRSPFYTTPIVLGSAATVNNRACGLRGANTTKTGARLCITDETGTAADDDGYFLIIGRDSQFTDAFHKFAGDVKGTRVDPRVLLFHVDGTGTASILNGTYDAALTDNGTGDYTLTFDETFSSAPIVVACATGTEASCAVTATSISACTIESTNAAGSATDTDFYAVVIGWDSTSEHGRLRRTLRSTQRKCGCLPMQAIYTAGTPSLALGGVFASTVDDDGTGDFGLNMAQTWRRTDPVAIACASETAGSFAHLTASNTALEVDVVDNAGTPADEAADIVCFQFDSPNQTGGR